MSIEAWLSVGMGLGILSLLLAFALYAWVGRQAEGSGKALRIAAAIRSGSRAYLKRLYAALGILSLAAGAGLGLLMPNGLLMAGAFVAGALCSGAAGFLGMSVALKANVRAAEAARGSLNSGFEVAYRAGAVLGLAMVGIAVFSLSLLYRLSRDPELLLGFSLGASSLALLAKAGGGIYTKTADIAADLVGKVEAGIPEDDPRNPAVIADNVGDNVGDVAGMGADIFDSYVAAVVAAMLLGATGFSSFSAEARAFYTILPLVFAIVGIVSSTAGIALVRVGRKGRPGAALNRGTLFSCFIYTGLCAALFAAFGWNRGTLFAAIAGLAAGVAMGFATDYFTDDRRLPVRRTAERAAAGPALAIISGLSYGFISALPSIVGIAAASVAAYFAAQANGLPGVYGVGIAAVGMLSLSGVVVSNDAYGPIVDNAKGIAEMSGMGKEVIERADALDSAGNTAKAITKGFAIGAAALTVLALFAAYRAQILAHLPAGAGFDLSLEDPLVVAGLLLGALVPPLFSALTMLAVTRNAFSMIEEVRRQFREIPGILLGDVPPDYEVCVDLAAKGALESLALPALVAVALPLVVGFVLGPAALGGFLGGSIVVGLVFALFMSNSGGLWDNAKKYVESGHLGGPGSETHKATVVGDTVGDPFKDAAGPSINTLTTVTGLAASLFAPLIAAHHL